MLKRTGKRHVTGVFVTLTLPVTKSISESQTPTNKNSVIVINPGYFPESQIKDDQISFGVRDSLGDLPVMF